MIGRVDAAAVGMPEVNAPKDIKQAAEHFESLLIGQMLRSARAGEGWFGTGEDSTAESAMGLAEEQFASAMAAQGGLGLSRLIAEGLDRKR